MSRNPLLSVALAVGLLPIPAATAQSTTRNTKKVASTDASKAQPTAAPTAKAAALPRVKYKPIRMNRVFPERVQVGDEVTIEGIGLDQGSQVLFGEFSPEIVRRSNEEIVFRATKPLSAQQDYEATVMLITPSHPVMSSGVRVVVIPRNDVPARLPIGRKGESLVQGVSKVSALRPRRYDLDIEGGKRLTIKISCKGGDVEARVTPIGVPGDGSVKVTYGGNLKWFLTPFDLTGVHGGEAPKRISLTLTTDSETDLEVDVSVEVTRYSEK